MISLNTARKLKAAGLDWQPSLHDFFAIPDRQMDQMVFVISDLLVTVDILQGMQVVSFQGASEWALDSLLTTEAIWLPSEEQLRQFLEAILISVGSSSFKLISNIKGYKCILYYSDKRIVFEDNDVSEAYANAILHIMKTHSDISSNKFHDN